MNTDFSSLITELEDLIRSGQGDLATKTLKQIKASDVPRRFAVQVAELATRSGLSNKAFGILNHIVRPKVEGFKPPRPKEKVIYAYALLNLGAFSEALSLLNEVPGEEEPEALLYKAIGHFMQWKYEEAIPILNEYLILQKDSYRQLVGKVNLSAALIFCAKYNQAKPILLEVIKDAEKRKLYLLKGNCLELLAQVYLGSDQLDKAEDCLKEASQAIKDKTSLGFFFIKKWQTFLEIKKLKASNEALEKLEDIRKEALNRNHWESVRDCDFYKSIHEKNKMLFLKVYFGTPYESFRNRMLNIYSKNIDLPKSHIIEIGSGPSNSPDVIDVDFGDFGPNHLKPGHVLQKTFKALCNDIYRPIKIPTLFSILYPDEYYNVSSSNHRVHEVIRRLKAWIAENDIPLEVLENAGTYKLEATRKVGIKVHLNMKVMSRVDFRLLQLSKHFQNKKFTASEAGELLSTSKRTAIRVLNLGIESDQVSTIGQGKSLKYSIKKVA